MQKKYYGLDEIGFVGVQDERAKANIGKDIQMTVDYKRKTLHDSDVESVFQTHWSI